MACMRWGAVISYHVFSWRCQYSYMCLARSGRSRETPREHPSTRQLSSVGSGPGDATLPLGCQGLPHQIGSTATRPQIVIHSPATSPAAPHSLISARARRVGRRGTRTACRTAPIPMRPTPAVARPQVAIRGFGLPDGALHRTCPSQIKQPRPPILHAMLPPLVSWSGELCLPPPHAEGEKQVGLI